MKIRNDAKLKCNTIFANKISKHTFRPFESGSNDLIFDVVQSNPICFGFLYRPNFLFDCNRKALN